MVMHVSALTGACRRRRVSMGTLVIASALAGLEVLWPAPARWSPTPASSSQEANLGFMIPTAMRGGDSLCNTGSAALVGTRDGVRRSPGAARQAEGIPQELAGVEVGDSVSGWVIEVRPNLLKIEVEGFSRAAISLPSLLEKSPTEYEVDDEFDGKVYQIDSRGWVVTQLDEPNMGATPEVDSIDRMEAKFEIGEVSSMLNEEMDGIVTGIRPFGIFVDIGVKNGEERLDALARNKRRFLPKGMSLMDFTPGQKVRCWVVGTDEAKRKISVSLVAPREGGLKEKAPN